MASEHVRLVAGHPRHALHAAQIIACAALAILCACGPSEKRYPLGPGAGGTLVIQVQPENNAVPVARALGWPTGVVPGATVTVRRAQETTTRTFTADSLGRVVVPNVLPGIYRVTAARVLSNAERDTLGAANDLSALGAGVTDSVAGALDTIRVRVDATTRGSLIITEYYFPSWYIPPASGYVAGGYLEVYNAADTTIYLDSIIIGSGFELYQDSPTSPCSINAPFRSDSLGIWAREFYSFPGSGHDYPLVPGAYVFVATDAIDHRVVYPELLDLSNANFEFLGPNDVDNPAVPNMVRRGINVDILGHGLTFHGVGGVAFLSLPTDTTGLVSALTPTAGRYFRFPRDSILDAAAIGDQQDNGDPFCPEMVSPAIDKAAAYLNIENDTLSVQRRLIGTLADGRALYQRTHTSAADFGRRQRSPGSP